MQPWCTKNLKNIFKNYNYYTGSVCVLYAVYNNTYYSCNSGSRTQEMFHHLVSIIERFYQVFLLFGALRRQYHIKINILFKCYNPNPYLIN